VLAAICWAPTILAKAGLLKGKKATVWVGPDAEYAKDTSEVLGDFGAEYVGKGCVVDGKVVTADGPATAKEMAQEIVKLLE
jgi:protease I